MPDIDEAADALWRATVYASVCQLHLRDNVLLTDPVLPEHVKPWPSGHWGTVPGTAWALAHVTLAAAEYGDRALIPLLGAGHAGVVQLAFSWLTGDLAGLRPCFTTDARGLAALSATFPDVGGLGAEVVPGLPAGDFLGGRLGGCLAFAQGAGMDAPNRIMVPVVGDGECETPATAASWMAHAAAAGAKVAPIVHVNGFRMGARSLLAAFGEEELRAWARGLGWKARVVPVVSGSHSEHAAFRQALLDTLADTDSGRPTLLIMRCRKGWGGPDVVGDQVINGNAHAHKTPLVLAATDDSQRAQLSRWLASYRPGELFDSAGKPHGALTDALAVARCHRLTPAVADDPPPLIRVSVSTFAEAVEQAVGGWGGTGEFRVFSPDELESNRLESLAATPFASEILAEEVLLEWLAGWTASGRRGLLVSYEAFASLLVPGLVSHMKQRRIPSAPRMPSLNVLLTSYGWHNTYTHGDPSAVTALLATCDPGVRVLTPADPARLAVALSECLASMGRVNVIVAGKHDTKAFPAGAIEEEQRRGLAVWPHVSDAGEPDLTIVTAGDLPARTVEESVRALHSQPVARLRVVNVADLTVLGDPAVWPRGLSDPELAGYLGASGAVLIVTLGHPAAVWGLLQGRLGDRRVKVIGWREPCSPMPQAALAEWAGMNAEAVAAAAGSLLASTRVPR
jgi:xylulose-5-phosphate/fructose-6-phosphate phosphoketolase